MHVHVHWGNVVENAQVSDKHIQSVIQKNLTKISRFLKKIDSSTVHINIHFAYDARKKRYTVVLYFVTPKSQLHITEEGFSLEETIKSSVHSLRRRFRKAKEKKITLNRKRS
ncbi:HPF/RaiA family ribosome-associated protein [Candidatus Dojkabacteria bacterium]|uniref:HPF/RaiA family ribosome-associated protein n=1 Tax=Candidatus Dojkabacteria bacterium TaxID=2099670 RepID=A0A955RKD1_9BACT|nr:HPF/RaiA family ribosome-associated protein [Candidatus Dojkabacteria bacterium]